MKPEDVKRAADLLVSYRAIDRLDETFENIRKSKKGALSHHGFGLYGDGIELDTKVFINISIEGQTFPILAESLDYLNDLIEDSLVRYRLAMKAEIMNLGVTDVA